ncbi:protein translocase subunit SecF [Candidatus Woesearchaeota archaeon]|nr:protein translocase subunit SecF [Candidatus Woesearchaeota archaeon]
MEEENHEKKKEFFLKKVYEKHYKKLLIIPALLLFLALVQIGMQIANTGDFLNKGVSLKGGLTISIETDEGIIELQDYLNSEFPAADISVRTLSRAGTQFGLIVEASDVDPDTLVKSLEEKLGIEKEEYSVEIMGSSLGASFFKETFRALILAFVFMGIVVFIYFRVPIPSLAVILAAFSDIIITLAIVNVLGMKLSTAGLAAFLMIIGYSVDTDILLSTRVLKRKEGEVIDRVFSAMKTGLTMSITTIAAVTVALIFSNSEVLKQIMTILLIGLLVDLISTWIQNAGILRWYVEKKTRRHHDGQN